jgi:CubicO group peptidase (beta-lactamase class C family)
MNNRIDSIEEDHMKKLKFLIIVIILSGLIIGISADDKVKSEKSLTLEEQVTKLFDKWNNPASPGAAVAVIRDGMVVYRNGFGCAQMEYNVPITPSTVFHVASVSKQFPAFAISLLEEQGKLSADDDIRKYLAWMPDFGHKITIRHLLNHTSGIRDQWELVSISGWRMEDVITQKDILYLLKRQKELNFKPGDQYMYSNSGFTLLTEIVATVTGQPFVEWMDAKVFKPLGMHNTHFHLDHRRIVKNRAYSYRQDRKRGLVKSILSYANVGATSLFTTVEDMANWMRNYTEMRVGNERVMARMFEAGVLNNGEKIDYARGLSVGVDRGLKFISHGGADAGFRSFMSYFPEEKFGVVVLSNLAQFNPGQTTQKIIKLYLKDKFKSVADSGPTVKRKAIRLSQKKMRKFTGSYWLSSSRLLRTMKLEGKKLFYVRSQGSKSELVPYSASALFMKEFPQVTVEFFEDKAGKYEKIKVTVGKQIINGDRIELFKPTPEDLKEYTGQFESEELEVRFRFLVDRKGLYLNHKKQHEDNHLQPLIKDIFSLSDGYSTLTFIRNQMNQISGFQVDTGRVRNLKFKKVK